MNTAARPLTRPLEWPTLLLFVAVYGAWIAVTLGIAHALDEWRTGHTTTAVLQLIGLFAGLSLLLTQHSSLQHEVIHGHPTSSQRLNSLLASPALGLLMPFERFEDLHLKHHRDWLLTDPFDDTESCFLSAAQWQSMNTLQRRVLQANNTLLGRLCAGPWLMYIRFFRNEYQLLRNGTAGVAGAWIRHLLGALPVLLWLYWQEIPLVLYLLGAVWPSTALLLLRAYTEHIPAAEVSERTAIVETTPLMGLLYLNNNLHQVHHDDPSLPWYEIPIRYRQRYTSPVAATIIKGYGYLFRQHALRARYPVAHPVLRTGTANSWSTRDQ